jgi:hypothetical protein
MQLPATPTPVCILNSEFHTSFLSHLAFVHRVLRLLVTAIVPSSPILVTLMKEAQVPPKRRFLQEPRGVTSQKTQLFIVTAVKTSNLTLCFLVFRIPDDGQSPEPQQF